MASQWQLLGMGIVDQMANLEGSLISMFLESSLRLANVINAEFFILVETPAGGRKVGGSEKLCRDFTRGDLVGNPAADFRVRLADEAVSIKEEPLCRRHEEEGLAPAAAAAAVSVADPLNFDGISAGSNNPSYPINANDNRETLEQVNPFTCVDRSPASHVDNSSTPNSNALRTISERHLNSGGGGGGGGGKRTWNSDARVNGVVSAKRLRANDFDAASGDDGIIMEQDDSVIKLETFDDEEDVDVIPTQHSLAFEEIDNYPHHHHHLLHHHSSSLHHNPSPHPSGVSGDHLVDLDFSAIQNYLSQSGKVACISERLTTGGIDLTKQSSDMRLLGSIMYDLGKLLSQHVKIPDKCHPETKKHFTKSYDVIWCGISGIDAFSRSQTASTLGDHFRGLSLKAFLRCQFYSAFKNSLQRFQQKSSGFKAK